MKHLLTILLLVICGIANAHNYTAKDTTINGAKYIVISGCSESKTSDCVLVHKTSGKVLIDVTHLDLLNKYIEGKLTDRNEIRTLSYSIKPLFGTLVSANNESYRKNAWFYNRLIMVTSSVVSNTSVMQPDDVVGNVTFAISKTELKVLLTKWLN